MDIAEFVGLHQRLQVGLGQPAHAFPEFGTCHGPVAFVHIPKEQALVIFRQILLALLFYLHGFPLSSKYS